MTAEEAPARPSPDRSELELLRSEHGNIAQLLLVLESHLALMSAGESCDTRLMLDAVGYLIDYVGRFHREREDVVVAAAAVEQPHTGASVAALAALAALAAQHDAARVDGAELCRRLELAIRDEPLDRRELVRLGFTYCDDLRRSMSLEETTLAGAGLGHPGQERRAVERLAQERPALERARRDAEERYRATFEGLTQRVGCDCAYARSS